MLSLSKKYTRRPGTSDLGREYEFKILALLCLRCLQEQKEEFWFLFNADKVGDFDDLIMHYGGKIFLVQLKHKARPKSIAQGEFLTSRHKGFYLKKYIEHIFNLRNALTNRNYCIAQLGSFEAIYFILYTNRNVNIDGTCDFLINSCESEEKAFSILNTANNHMGIFKFDISKLEQKLNLKSVDYLDKFYLFSSQIHVKDIDKEINKEVEKITKIRDPKDISEDFVKYVTEWCKGNLGGNHSLTKQDIVSKLTELVCSQFEVEEIFQKQYSFYECKRKLLWNDIVKDKTITILDVKPNDEMIVSFLSEFIGSEVKDHCEVTEKKDWFTSIPKRNKTLFYSKNENSKFQMQKLIGNRSKISFRDIQKYLWHLNKLPIALKVNSIEQYNHIINMLKLTNYSHRAIIINEIGSSLSTDKISNRLQSLNDLEEKHQRIILDQEIKLQGRSGPKLKDLIDETMLVNIKIVDIINILLNNFSIDEAISSVPEYYINRGLSKTFIKFEALKKITNEIFLIEDFKGGFETKAAEENVKISMEEISSKKLNPHRFVVNYHLDNPEIGELFVPGEAFHHLIYYNDDYLEWKRSSKNVESLRPYQVDCGIIPECDIDFTANLLTILSAPPGMGKSMLMDHIAQQVPLDNWVLRIDLYKHQDYYENDYKCRSEDTKSAEHFNYFRQSSKTILFNKIFDRFLRKKKVIVILDGFDEISILYKQEVTNIVKSLNNDGFCTWLTTRPIMKSYLEEEFNTFALSLFPFTQNIQKEFLTKYLNILCQNNKEFRSDCDKHLNEFVDELLRIFKRNIIDRNIEFTSTPLHIKLLGDYFYGDWERYVINGERQFDDKFDLLDLYDKFIKSKNKILCDKFGSGSKELRTIYKDYQSIYALKLLFPTYKKLLDEYLIGSNNLYTSRNHIQLLQKEGILTVDEHLNIGFTHRTFAEYLAAESLSINFKSKDANIKDIATLLMTQRFGAESRVLKEYVFLFTIFDSLLSQDLHLHLSIINGQMTKENENIDANNLVKLDKARRSVVHLITLYVRFYPSLLDILPSILQKLPDDSEVVHTDMLGCNPLDYALMNNNFEIANLICQKWSNSKININLDLRLQERYLRRSSHSNHMFVFDTMLAYFVYRNILLKNLDIQETIHPYVKQFLPFDISRQYKNIKPLELVKFHIYHDSSKLVYEIVFGNKDTIEKVLKKDKNINLRDVDGKTSLHYAVIHDKLELIDLLISKNAEVNVRRFCISCPLYYVRQGIFHKTVVAMDDINDDDGNTPLHCAVLHKRSNMINLLLSKGSDVNFKNFNGETSLHYATKHANSEIVNELLLPKTNINALDNKGNTPLHVALIKRKREIALLLLSKGVDVNIRNISGNTPLHISVRNGELGISTKLLIHKTDINIQNGRGFTPLHFAVAEHKIDIIPLLLSNNADTNIQDINGDSLFHLGIVYYNFYIFSSLLSHGGNINLENNKGNTPLHFACQKGNLEAADLLLSNGAEVNIGNFITKQTPLFFGVMFCHLEVVKKLIEHKADVNVSDSITGNTPLHDAVIHQRLDIVHFLLKSNADINIKSRDGDTPFHLSAKFCDCEIVEKFITLMANINVTNAQGNSPLYCAVSTENMNVIQLLLSRGADVNMMNLYGDTPLHYGVRFASVKVVEVLIAHKADVNVLNHQGNSPLYEAISPQKSQIRTLLLSKGAHVNTRNLEGNTPLHRAVFTNTEIVDLLLQNKAKVDAVNTNGNTPLIVALSRGMFKMCHFLLSKGAEVNITNLDGDTPLLCAARFNNIEILDTLISHGIDVNRSNNKGDTPLHYATLRGKLPVVEFLLSKGADLNKTNACGETALDYIRKRESLKSEEQNLLLTYAVKNL